MELGTMLHTVQMTNPDDSPDGKIHGASVGPTWGHRDPGGPHVGHMNFVTWELKWLIRHFHVVVQFSAGTQRKIPAHAT